MKRYSKTKKNGGKNYDNLENMISKIKNDVETLGEIIEKLSNQRLTETKVSNEISDNIHEKMEEETEELNNIIEKIEGQEKQIQENANKIEDHVDDTQIEVAKKELEKNITLLEEKIDEGLPKERPSLQKQQRDSSFYLQGRTWNQWFYGFVEYYSEIKANLNNIMENSYYVSILQKPKKERSQPENHLIDQVNNIEVELSKMNNNVIKGGYLRKMQNKKSKKRKIKK